MARPLTVTAFGNAQVDTAEKKAGTGSLLLDGTGDYLRVDQPNGELNVGDNLPWTIECWVYWVGGGNNDYAVMSSRQSGTTTSWVLGIEQRTTVQDRISWGNQSISISYQEFIASDQWHHIAVICNGTDVYLYLNGAQVAGPVSGNTSISSTTSTTNNPLRIGDDNIAAGFGDFNGWIDEVKISDVQRYSGTFTPKAALGIDANTLLHLQMDGTDGSTTFTDDVGITGSASISASFNIDRADGRTYLRAEQFTLSASATLTSTATPNPSIVFLGNDVYTWDQTDTWTSIYDSDDQWRVWERQEAAFTQIVVGGISSPASADLTSTAQLTADGRLSDVRGSADFVATAALTASATFAKFAELDTVVFGDLSVSAVVNVAAKADLSSQFTQETKGGLLVEVNELYDYTWDTVPEDIWNGYPADRWEPRGWFAFSNIELTVSSGRSVDASATLEAFVSQLSAGRTSDVRASADLTSAFDLQAAADNFKSASAELAAESQLQSGSQVDVTGRAELSAEFNTTFTARILKLASLETVVFGDLSVRAEVEHNAQAELSAETALTLSADKLVRGQSSQDSVFGIATSADKLIGVGSEMSAEFGFTTQGGIIQTSGATLEAFASELTIGQRLPGGSAVLQGQFVIDVDADLTLDGRVEMSAFAAQLTAGRLSDIRGSAELTAAFGSEFAGDLKLLDSQFVFRVLHETRNYLVESETRVIDVLPETRAYEVESETRNHKVLQENRTIEVGYLMQ